MAIPEFRGLGGPCPSEDVSLILCLFSFSKDVLNKTPIFAPQLRAGRLEKVGAPLEVFGPGPFFGNVLAMCTHRRCPEVFGTRLDSL